MLRNCVKNEERGQAYLEYSLVVGAVILIMFSMSTMVQRGTQSMIKTMADQIGNQENSEQKFDDSGHLVSSYTSARSTSSKNTNEFIRNISYTTDERTVTTTNVHVNLGFTNSYQ